MKYAMRLLAVILFLAVWSYASAAPAQVFVRHAIRRVVSRPGPGGSVNLPYVAQDGSGSQWMVFAGGWIRQSGPQQVVGQAEVLTVNGMNVDMNGNANMGQLDSRTGELVLDNLSSGQVQLSRRIQISKTEGTVRYIDIFSNSTSREMSLTVSYQSNMNFGITNASVINDPRHTDNPIGWVAFTGANIAAMEMYGGKGAKLIPAVTYQPNSNVVQAAFQFKIAAGKSAAILHFVGTMPTYDAAQQWMVGMKESATMRAVPPDLRRIIVNFGQANQAIGDYEILRGDSLDVVELRSGDQFKGTLDQDAYHLTTSYGPIVLQPTNVIGMLNVGQFRPRQLFVTVDGQVFGGQLDKDAIAIQLSSGQRISVPLSQVSRVGYRIRPHEPEEWNFEGPLVLMRTGERMRIKMPTAPLDVDTRYGALKLDAAEVDAIAFVSPDTGVHEVFMADGSHFSGLVTAPQFSVDLSDAAGGATVKLIASQIQRMQLVGKNPEPDDSQPSLSLVNDDLMVGSLEGTLSLDTAFDTLQINAAEIKKLTHTSASSDAVQITLWDNTSVGGQLREQDLQCRLLCGAAISVPIDLVGEYNQPFPRPSPAMIQKINQLVAQLGADDWKQRQSAESELVSDGSPVISILRDLRPSQNAEAQARIDAILKQLTDNTAKS